MNVGKKPSILEKRWACIWGVILNCLLVRVANSRAVISPRAVTSIAESLRGAGMVIMLVLDGNRFEVSRSPVMMLPQARRLIGLIIEGLFSLMGDMVLNRGWSMNTKNTIRKL